MRLEADLGSPVGTRGQTGVRIILEESGAIKTTFPVNPRQAEWGEVQDMVSAHHSMKFVFTDMRFDSPQPDYSNLDIYYSWVAGAFAVEVDGEKFYKEIEFPVVELADSLVVWSRNAKERRQPFDFAPTGYVEGDYAIQLHWEGASWKLDSFFRQVGAPIVRISDIEVDAAGSDFLTNLRTKSAGAGVNIDGAFFGSSGEEGT